jgi:O-antigen/teichoic acid export membrane protein
MSDREVSPLEKRSLAMLQIIVGSLTAGALLFAGVASAVAMGNGDVTVATILAALSAGPILASFGMPPLVEKQMRERLGATSGAAPFAVYQTRTMVGAALLESAAFLNLIGYLVSRAPWALAVGVACAVGIAIVHFPTMERYLSWRDRTEGTKDRKYTL